ncbi:MAG: serine protease [Pirellulales bacterium]
MGSSTIVAPRSLEERGYDAFLQRRTVRLIDESDDAGGGSGVTIEIDNRQFIATAAHVLKNGHDIRLLTRESGSRLYGNFRAVHKDSENDIAIIELDVDESPHEWHEYLKLDDCSPDFDPTVSIPVRVCGYPGDCGRRIQREDDNGDTLIINAYATLHYVTDTIPFLNWPAVGLNREPDKDTDIFCGFSPTDHSELRNLRSLESMATWIAIDDLRLNGASGGGIWRIDAVNCSGSIWEPKASLVGIQTSYSPQGEWLRGTRISALLQLFVQHYPDLRKDLSS